MEWRVVVALLVGTGASLCAGQVTDPVTSDVNINCGACKGLFDELDYLISKVPSYAKIDVGSARLGSDGKMAEKKKSYARSEVHLTEILETVCVEMKNYSGFTEDLPDGTKRTIYHRYQNRPEETGPLKLQHFGWSADTQQRLRLACDAIAAVIEEDLIEAYMAEVEVPFKKKACKYYCDKAGMAYMLNAWDGLDFDGKPLAPEDTEYDENGRVNADRLRIKNEKEQQEKKRLKKAEKKAEKQRKKLEAQAKKKKKKEEESAHAEKDTDAQSSEDTTAKTEL